MKKRYVLSAPTNLGNRPYPNGEGRLTTRGPARLLEERLADRIGAEVLKEVAAPAYRDVARPPGGILNEDLILEHNRNIGQALDGIEDFVLLLGGDCSTLLGSLLGLSRDRDLALVFLDGHSDFWTVETSQSGGAAAMELSLATGRGSSELARLRGTRPLVRDQDVVAIGVRDGDFGQAPIRTATSPSQILEHVGDRPFFVHLDVDVLDPLFMPFVDSPEPNGMTPDEVVSILKPLVNLPGIAGMGVTIYDPRDDHDGKGARQIVEILERAFVAEEFIFGNRS